jgi:uncharacterized protein (DUF305 family)
LTVKYTYLRGLWAASTLVAVGACTASRPATSPAKAPSAQNASSPARTGETPAAATPAAAEHHHHMEGMTPVTIPAGAMITEADVRFMQGMIGHHAQAVHMTRMAAGAGASARVLKLAQKIDLSQAGEIVLMQEWLAHYKQQVPDTSSWRGMSMPGMLTSDELAQLEKARGVNFDRMFLQLMIRHHEGAIKMVADLFASPRAGQEVDVSVFANDVETTQTAEIGLMLQMLAELR